MTTLGILRRYLTPERAQELLRELKRVNPGVDILKVAVAQVAKERAGLDAEDMRRASRLCQTCRQPLPAALRKDAKFCSKKCRMAARNRKRGGLVRVRRRNT